MHRMSGRSRNRKANGPRTERLISATSGEYARTRFSCVVLVPTTTTRHPCAGGNDGPLGTSGTRAARAFMRR